MSTNRTSTNNETQQPILATPKELPPDLAMSWQNYAVRTLASVILMVSCWAVGAYSLSFLWIVIFSALYVLKTHLWIQREEKRMKLRAVALRERDIVMAQFAQMGDLPAWVQFPDTERIEWVNKVLQQLWPYIGAYSKQFLTEFIEPQVRAQMPSPFKSFKFINIDMGDMPCRVGGLKVYTQNVGRDKIIVDMDVVYAGDAEFTVSVCGFTGGLNQLVVTGKVRCVMQPLLPCPPMIGGISGSFVELPKFDFNLTGMGEFVQLPGLIDAIRTVVNAQVANLCVLPNKIVVPLAPNVDVTKLYFPEPDGIIRLKIIEARNLVNKDISVGFIKDKSDPYCEIRLGSQLFKTRTINNNLNPVFNEYFEAVVDQANGQMLRIELFDEDTTSADEELGRLSVPLEIVRQSGWFHLEGCKHGELHLKCAWYNLSSDLKHMSQQSWENEWLSADKPMHPALLMVFVDNVSDLPYPKAELEPSPFVEVTLGRVAQRTPVKVKTVNPLFQSKFVFFVKQPEGQELKFVAYDDGTKRPLGELSIPLLSLMKQPNLEMFQNTFHLTHGVHTSPIVVTVRLRTFESVAQVDTFYDQDIGKTYGTASHIERANANNSSNNAAKPPKPLNGDVTSTEPGKTVDNGMMLDAHNISLTVSNPSISESNTSTLRRERGFLGRMRRSKHSRKSSMPREENFGELQIGLKYDDLKFKLNVNVGAARNLNPVDNDGQADPYISVKLYPVNSNTPKVKRKTGIVEKNLNPTFDNQFDFDIHYSDLHNYKLKFLVKDAINYGVLSKPPTLGTLEIPLENFSRDEVIQNRWLPLERSNT